MTKPPSLLLLNSLYITFSFEPQEAQCSSVCLPQTKVETREERLLKAKYAVAAHSMALPPLLGRYALIQAAGLSVLLGIYAKDQLDNLT